MQARYCGSSKLQFLCAKKKKKKKNHKPHEKANKFRKSKKQKLSFTLDKKKSKKRGPQLVVDLA